MTRGVSQTIPSWFVILLWHLIATMQTESKDYLQVFRMQKTGQGQHITHTQKQPPYSMELFVPCVDAVNAKLLVIDDSTHSTMLLAWEY
nr:DUF960 family protein [uncultured Agathobaculum sp.]